MDKKSITKCEMKVRSIKKGLYLQLDFTQFLRVTACRHTNEQNETKKKRFSMGNCPPICTEYNSTIRTVFVEMLDFF